VNDDVLMARVARGVKDKRLLRLLRRYSESGGRGDLPANKNTPGSSSREEDPGGLKYYVDDLARLYFF
jgi:hypothetical protein